MDKTTAKNWAKKMIVAFNNSNNKEIALYVNKFGKLFLVKETPDSFELKESEKDLSKPNRKKEGQIIKRLYCKDGRDIAVINIVINKLAEQIMKNYEEVAYD